MSTLLNFERPPSGDRYNDSPHSQNKIKPEEQNKNKKLRESPQQNINKDIENNSENESQISSKSSTGKLIEESEPPNNEEYPEEVFEINQTAEEFEKIEPVLREPLQVISEISEEHYPSEGKDVEEKQQESTEIPKELKEKANRRINMSKSAHISFTEKLSFEAEHDLSRSRSSHFKRFIASQPVPIVTDPILKILARTPLNFRMQEFEPLPPKRASQESIHPEKHGGLHSHMSRTRKSEITLSANNPLIKDNPNVSHLVPNLTQNSGESIQKSDENIRNEADKPGVNFEQIQKEETKDNFRTRFRIIRPPTAKRLGASLLQLPSSDYLQPQAFRFREVNSFCEIIFFSSRLLIFHIKKLNRIHIRFLFVS